MIKKLTDSGILSGVSSPLLPLLYSAFRYPVTDIDGVYVQTNDGCVQSFVSVKNNCAVVCIICDDYCADELTSFLSFLHIGDVLSNYPLADGYSGVPLLMTEPWTVAVDGVVEVSPLWGLSQYKALYDLLSDDQGDFDSWFTDFSRKVNDGVAFGICDRTFVSCAVATCVYGENGIIAGVFTQPEFRGKGMATRCVDALLNTLYVKGVKNAFLWCNQDKVSFYEKSGFHVIGSLYIRKEM